MYRYGSVDARACGLMDEKAWRLRCAVYGRGASRSKGMNEEIVKNEKYGDKWM